MEKRERVNAAGKTKAAKKERKPVKKEKKPADNTRKRTKKAVPAEVKGSSEDKRTVKKTAERQKAEKKTSEKKSAERKTAEKKGAEKKTAEKKTAEKKTVERKTVEEKVLPAKMEREITPGKPAADTAASGKKTIERKVTDRKTKGSASGKKSDSKVRIIPLGGLNRIGMNITAIETEESIVVVDCGLSFPDETMLGIGRIVPDVTWLIQHRDKVKAFVITHGHEDHIGAIPNVIQQVNVPIYATRLTIGLIEHKLEEAGLLDITVRRVVEQGETVQLDDVSVEFIRTNHSIAGACSLAITTPAGVLFHTGDFKIDYTPLFGDPIDLQRIAILGSKGILAVLSDSTNAIRPGFTPSEINVANAFDDLFAEHTGSRILVATFASNVDRVQQLIYTARKFGRKVIIQGRSMESVLEIAEKLGYLTMPEDTLISVDEMNNYPDDKLVFITTGSQGEAMAALSRMANSTHKKITIKPGDAIMFSSNPIPGNEKAVSKVMNELSMKGAHVIYQDTHVSGHACAQEIQLIYTLLKPRYVIPVHGEYRHLKASAEIAAGIGIPKENIFVLEAGDVLELSKKEAAVVGSVQAREIYLDGTGGGDVGLTVIKDRQNLAEHGFVMIAVAVEAGTGRLAGMPQVLSRGFVFLKESEELIQGIGNEAAMAVDRVEETPGYDIGRIKSEIKNRVEDYIWRMVQKNPIILATVIEV